MNKMKANVISLNESMDRVKIELETKDKSKKLKLANIIRRHGIRHLVPKLIQVSVKMTPPAGEDSPMKLEIVL